MPKFREIWDESFDRPKHGRRALGKVAHPNANFGTHIDKKPDVLYNKFTKAEVRRPLVPRGGVGFVFLPGDRQRK